MATKMNLWSLTLLPGEKYPMYIRRDFVLTNAALGEDLRSNDGRSVVKVTHQPLPPHFGDDSDSEFDSDLEIDDDDEELDEDEFELDEEEGFKLTPKKGKAAANGEAMDEDDEEEDDEEEDDEEDDEDEDFSDDEEVEETNVICSLTAGKTEQTSLDLTFVAGDAVMFEVTGENAVHLLGNYIYQPGAEDSDDESDFDDEHDDYSDLELDSDEEDEEEAPAGKITEIAEAAPKAAAAKPKAKVEAAAAPAAAAGNKRKADAIESPAAKAAAADESAEGLSKAQKKKLAKKAKRDSEGAAPAAAAAPVQEKKPEPKKESKIKKLPNGLIIEDVTVGDGPVAKTGKRLGMRYIGKLENGKQFDANTSGKAFTFVLGRGEVIKGWDQGLVGMHVGGERRLTIPAPLAYGNQKLPGIPKGSTLKFDVKLVSVN